MCMYFLKLFDLAATNLTDQSGPPIPPPSSSQKKKHKCADLGPLVLSFDDIK